MLCSNPTRATLSLLFLIPMLLLGCERVAPSVVPESKLVAPDTTPIGWSASLSSMETIGGSSGLTVKGAASDATSPAVANMLLTPGSIIETDGRSRARFTLDAGGEVELNHSTSVELVGDVKRGLRVLRGQAIIAMPHSDEARETRVYLPTGEVVLRGTKVGVVAAPNESIVTVTQGEVAVLGEAGEPLIARAGQEIYLERSAGPYITSASNLESALGWSGGQEQTAAIHRGLGTLTGKTPGEEREWPLRKQSQNVVVTIQGAMAYTEITEVFQNESSQTIEGVYRFPLPDDAQISRLALKVGNRIMEGEFVENARAARIWRDLIDQWRDPAWLRWVQGDQFELRIFPIEPRSSRQVTIGYTQRLQSSANGHTYTYPMAYDTIGRIPADQFTFHARISTAVSAESVRVHGYPARVETQRVTTASGKDVVPTGALRGVAVDFDAQHFVATGDLSIRIPEDDDGRELRAYGYADPRRSNEPGYAVLSIRPNLLASSETRARDVVLIADVSHRRRGAALDLQRKLLPQIVREMDPLDRVVVIACAERCRAVGPRGFDRPSMANADAIANELATIEAEGSTNLVEALRVAGELARSRSNADASNRALHFVFATNGIASSGELRAGKIAEATRAVVARANAQMTVIDLGGDGDILALEALARAGRGALVRLTPGNNLGEHALRVLGRVYGSALHDLRVELPKGFEQVYPSEPLSLGRGEELVIVARLREQASGEVVLRATYAGEAFERRLPINIVARPEAGNAFASRLWAEQRIRDLEFDAERDHRAEIVALSIRHGLLSRHTSLLALEDENMMREFNVRREHRPNWSGADEAVESGPTERADSSAESKSEPAPRSQVAPSPAKKMAPSDKGLSKSGDMDDMFGSGSAGAPTSSFPRDRAEPMPMRSSYRRARPVAQFSLSEPRSPSAQALRRVETHRKAAERDVNARLPRRSLIRSLVQAEQIETAEREIVSWLERDPMDSEAILAHSQLMAYRGQIAQAEVLLSSAIDANPRAKWLHERVQAAFDASGDDAMACAHAVSLEALLTRAPKSPLNILDCPLATDLGPFGLGSAPVRSTRHKSGAGPKGEIVVELEWSGRGDLDLALVEPDGRLLSWMSQRRNVKVSGVRGPGPETLALPTAQNGTWRLHLLRQDDGDHPINARVTVRAGSQSRQFHVTVTGRSTAVAEINRSVGYR
ncbi:MAG: FecR domain-containing protein [Bradymonadaceae bacterium]|nr:FecR domain-containing protein [Lujinxingiaceae bacterium]